MKARAKDVLQTLKEKIPSNILSDIERVLTDLYQIRDSESKTEEYYNRFLHADYRYQIRDRDYQFNYNEGEIDKNIAKEFRFHLLKLVKDDPSFGYIYYLLGVEQNCHWGSVMYDCVPKEPNILFYIKYTWKDHEDAISNLPETEKLKALITVKAECRNSNFPIDLKKEFIEKCETEICMIREIMALPKILQESDPDIDNNLSNITSPELVLFDKAFVDKLRTHTVGLFRCSDCFLLFNKPDKCEIDATIFPGSQKRTQYLLKKMCERIKETSPDNLDISNKWLCEIAYKFGINVENIKKVRLDQYDKNASFKSDLDNFFALNKPKL